MHGSVQELRTSCHFTVAKAINIDLWILVSDSQTRDASTNFDCFPNMDQLKGTLRRPLKNC